jgi:hypothetical protein
MTQTPTLDIGETGYTHTINVARGLLFLNFAGSAQGCRVYDLTANPMSPKYLFRTAGSGRDCHDSYVLEDVNGKDLLITSDGSGRCQRIWDITNVDSSWSSGLPPIIGQTNQISGIYAHSNWVSEDKRYLFSFEENNQIDMSVHDISDPTSPIHITTFQYADNDKNNALPHNGEVRGQYLYVAYYEAGLRVFDISNPYTPYEVGKDETHRDPNGDGSFTQSIRGNMIGAWNTYPFLPSGNILVNDRSYGLFICKVNPPYSSPSSPTVSIGRDGSDNVVLSWTSVENVRGYAVERSLTVDGTYEVIAEHLDSTGFVDTSVKFQAAFYKVKAVNGEGFGVSSILSSAGATIEPSQSPTTPAPTSSCGNGVCEMSEAASSCATDCGDLSFMVNGVGAKGAQGSMFEVRVTRSIAVSSLDFFSGNSNTEQVQVYTRPGSYIGHEMSETGWTLVYEKDVNLRGRDSLTELGAFETDVTIEAGNVQSFFIWTAGIVMYDGGTREGDLHSSNDAVNFYQGIGITSKFSGSYANEVYSPRVFKGVIRYSAISLASQPSRGPSISPTPAPTIEVRNSV